MYTFLSLDGVALGCAVQSAAPTTAGTLHIPHARISPLMPRSQNYALRTPPHSSAAPLPAARAAMPAEKSQHIHADDLAHGETSRPQFVSANHVQSSDPYVGDEDGGGTGE